MTIFTTLLLLFMYFFDPLELEWEPRERGKLTLLPGAILFHSEFYRVFSGAILHGSDEHVILNCISFLWKGSLLETKRFGSSSFLAVLFILTGATGLVHCALAYALDGLVEGLWTPCVGFSGVIFALKVLMPETGGSVMGMRLPGRWACWAELVIIQLAVPNASMTGHAAGILTGLAFGYLWDLTNERGRGRW